MENAQSHCDNLMAFFEELVFEKCGGAVTACALSHLGHLELTDLFCGPVCTVFSTFNKSICPCCLGQCLLWLQVQLVYMLYNALVPYLCSLKFFCPLWNKVC